jgi:GPH family glycoside/pentoside/hexuronide:cation symporter
MEETVVKSIENTISTSPIGWTLGVGTIGIVCVILFSLCFSWTKERVTQIESDENVSVKQDLKNLFHNAPWWILIGTGLVALLFNAIRDSVAIYYFRDYVRVNYRMAGTGWDATTIYLLVGQAANLIGVVAAPAVSAKYGKKRTYMISILMAGILSTGFYFVSNNVMLILILQFFTSIFAGYVLPLLWSMFADIVDHQELTTGTTCNRIDFFVFFYVSKIRVGVRSSFERMDFGNFQL